MREKKIFNLYRVEKLIVKRFHVSDCEDFLLSDVM